MGKLIGIFFCLISGHNAFCMNNNREPLSLKQTAIKVILTNLTTYSPQQLHNLSPELVDEIMSQESFQKSPAHLVIDPGKIGTIKFTCFSTNIPRVLAAYKARYTNLLVCTTASRPDGDRTIAVYKVPKKKTYSREDVINKNPLITADSPWQPIISCLTLHPHLPIIAWGSVDGTVSLLILSDKYKRTTCAYALHKSCVEAIGFDVSNNCLISCDMNKTVYMWPIGYEQSTVKIKKAHALFFNNLIDDSPPWISNRMGLPLTLIDAERPFFKHILLELCLLKMVLKQNKSDAPALIQRLEQFKAYFKSLEIDPASQEVLTTNLERLIARKKEDEQKAALPPWIQIFRQYKKK